MDRSRTIRTACLVWSAWTVLALFLGVSTSLTYRSLGRAANWRLNVGRALADWWLWALLTPAVVWLARRFPVDGPARWRHLAWHLLAGSVIAVAKTLVDRLLFMWISGARSYLLLSAVALNLVIYGGVVAAAHGLEYYRRSREREALERRLVETRLQLLAMQLQPHFLFNALNTIAELVHLDPAAADDMIVGLSDLLRRTLDVGDRQEITLDEELDLLAGYVDIQSARFGDRLHVTVTTDAGARHARVPVLLLQPLVENAIRHGLAQHAGHGRIDVAARRDGRTLRIEVVDDGGQGSTEATPAGSGVGLANVRARLEALYATDCRLELRREASGARVVVELPFRDGGA